MNSKDTPPKNFTFGTGTWNDEVYDELQPDGANENKLATRRRDHLRMPLTPAEYDRARIAFGLTGQAIDRDHIAGLLDRLRANEEPDRRIDEIIGTFRPNGKTEWTIAILVDQNPDGTTKYFFEIFRMK